MASIESVPAKLALSYTPQSASRALAGETAAPVRRWASVRKAQEPVFIVPRAPGNPGVLVHSFIYSVELNRESEKKVRKLRDYDFR